MTNLQQPKTPPVKHPVGIKRLGINDLHPLARATALRLAAGDVRRIEVRSATEAVVH